MKSPLEPPVKSVRASQLVKGSIYFMVSYVDNTFVTPVVEPLVFLGRGIKGDSDGKLHFQDAESYLHEGPYPDTESEHQELLCFPDNGLGSILEFDEVVEELKRCLVRRRR